MSGDNVSRQHQRAPFSRNLKDSAIREANTQHMIALQQDDVMCRIEATERTACYVLGEAYPPRVLEVDKSRLTIHSGHDKRGVHLTREFIPRL